MNNYGYVYLTTNLINGKRYIGQHKSKQFDKRYKGSGSIVRKAFDKYGIDNFSTIILEWFDTKESLDYGEQFWISYYDAVQNPLFYNLDRGGKAQGRRPGHEVTQETREKLRKLSLGVKLTDETKQKISATLKARGVNKGDKNPAKREDVRAKFRILNAGENSPVWGKHWYTNGIDNVVAFECPSGYRPGRTKRKVVI